MKIKYREFCTKVMAFHAAHGRKNLPWRFSDINKPTPYQITVSEIMLQQTQVERVIKFFNAWMKKFPTWESLAKAPQSEVLRLWKGLGYNSRALRLQKLSQVVTAEYSKKIPRDYDVLIKLPGIGPYTAGAIRAFAFNLYTPLIETNIRRVFIHHFFQGKSDVEDKQIFEIMNDMGTMESPRKWYAALMDYGSTLPKIIKFNPNKKSKHYVKQSKFKGSDREIRGKILEILLENSEITEKKLCEILGNEKERYEKIISNLEKENFLMRKEKLITLK